MHIALFILQLILAVSYLEKKLKYNNKWVQVAIQ